MLGGSVNKVVNYEFRIAGERQLETAINRVKGAAVALAGAYVGLLANSVRLAAENTELQNQFETVFRESAPAAREELEKFAETTNRFSGDLVGMAAQVQDTFVPLGFARDQAAGLSVDLTKLATDLASFKNMLPTEAMRNLTSGLVGNHEAWRSFGVVVTQSTLDTELLRMGIEGGTRAATEQEKVMARLNILYRSTADAQGDAARTADEGMNAFRGLAATAKELQVEIGEKLLPVIIDHMPEFKSAMIAAADAIESSLGPTLQLIENLAALAEWGAVLISTTSDEQAIIDMFNATLDEEARLLRDDVAAGLKTAAQANDELYDRSRELGATVDMNLDIMEDVWTHLENNYTPAMIEHREKVNELAQSYGALGQAQLRQLALQSAMAGDMDRFSAAVQAYEDAIDRIDPESTAGMVTVGDLPGMGGDGPPVGGGGEGGGRAIAQNILPSDEDFARVAQQIGGIYTLERQEMSDSTAVLDEQMAQIDRNRMERQTRLNNQMLDGAGQMAQILIQGGDQLEAKMLEAAAKFALRMAASKIPGFGPFASLLGGFF